MILTNVFDPKVGIRWMCKFWVDVHAGIDADDGCDVHVLTCVRTYM